MNTIDIVSLLIAWTILGFLVNLFCYQEMLIDTFSTLQRIFFHLITGPVGWLTGLWKLLSFY